MSLLEELLNRRPPGRIYHYTSQSGLIGIVKNKCIWATSIHHLNDATEFEYARGNMKRIIDEKPRDGATAALSEELTDRLTSIARVNLFVACFSEKEDLLSQWRAYCPNGNGYSIGFTYDQLENQITAQQFFLAPCIYEVNEQEKLLREIVDEAFEKARQLAIPGISPIAGISRIAAISAITNECIDKFELIGPALKHPTFAEEAEWRLISKCPKPIFHQQIGVREGKSMLLPYFQFKLAEETETLPSPRVVVGPNPHMDLAIRSVHFLLGNFGADVTATTIPYRAW